ncbi:FCD domain-containing protein [Streptomyces sp. SID11726]|nr:FCD domain-containing protein [Streptomyces sp. SID11726]
MSLQLVAVALRLPRRVRHILDPHTVSHDHHEIVEAIAAGDGELAESLAEEHAERNRRTTLEAMFGAG